MYTHAQLALLLSSVHAAWRAVQKAPARTRLHRGLHDTATQCMQCTWLGKLALFRRCKPAGAPPPVYGITMHDGNK
jgi:hypothetical protein